MEQFVFKCETEWQAIGQQMSMGELRHLYAHLSTGKQIVIDFRLSASTADLSISDKGSPWHLLVFRMSEQSA